MDGAGPTVQTAPRTDNATEVIRLVAVADNRTKTWKQRRKKSEGWCQDRSNKIICDFMETEKRKQKRTTR